jgi:hypothetical protein
VVRASLVLASSLLALAATLSGQQTPPAAPAAPAYDRAPSDPAALGFLTGVVDRRLYSLEAAGATKVSATVHAAWEGRTDAPPPLDFEVACDVASGSVTSRPLAAPADSVKPLLPALYALGHTCFELLPSRANGTFVLAIAQEGELTRIDYKPRSPATSEKSHSEWHKKDGTPVRRKFETLTAQGTVAIQEVVPEFTEADGRLLLKEMKAADPKVHLSMQFEYAKVDGYRVLKRLVQTMDDVKIVLDFKVKVEAAPK